MSCGQSHSKSAYEFMAFHGHVQYYDVGIDKVTSKQFASQIYRDISAGRNILKYQQTTVKTLHVYGKRQYYI